MVFVDALSISMEWDDMPTSDILTSTATVPNLQRPNSLSNAPSSSKQGHHRSQTVQSTVTQLHAQRHKRRGQHSKGRSPTDPTSNPHVDLLTGSDLNQSSNPVPATRSKDQLKPHVSPKKRTESAPNAKQRQLPSDYIFKSESASTSKLKQKRPTVWTLISLYISLSEMEYEHIFGEWQ